VHGWLDFSGGNRSNWDVEQDIKQSLLWPYCGNSAAIWKCPADLSTVRSGNVVLPRVRSLSMNAWLDSTDISDSSLGGAGFRVYKKMSDLVDPGPAMTWVFLDEREDSINDGEFCVSMIGYPDQPQQWKMVDYPASYHHRAGGFAFADGHSEIKKWRDPRTMPVLRKGQELPLNVLSTNNLDVYWMMERSTRSTR
jgi:hypothetical protein